MLKLCLFDLDQTLVDTEDMKALREAGKHRNDAGYAAEVQTAFKSRQRNIIDETTLLALLSDVPGLRLGIFTRSPRGYVDAVLAIAYAHIDWGVVIAYEDVKHCKPDGEGILVAMISMGLGEADELPHVLLVGDSDVDIRAAYNAGCRAILFKKGWPWSYLPTHWRSLSLIPDVVTDTQEELRDRIQDPVSGLPDLERLLEAGIDAPPPPRFDEVAKFLPDHSRHVMHTAGRYFPLYENLKYRREWHALSQSIQANKDSVSFPPEWIETIRRFIASQYRYLAAIPRFGGTGPEVVVTAIPARPGRNHRLGNLITQLGASYGVGSSYKNLLLTFDATVLAYRPGVQSQSNDYLNQEQRFANVREHLYVGDPSAAQGKKFLVIDDVSTSGATLLYAKKYLTEAGANSVDCFSLAQTISDPLRYQ